MGCVQQAVLEFDEEVQAPWRPRLVAVPAVAVPPARPVERRPSRRSPSRVGVCRPPAPTDNRPRGMDPSSSGPSGRGSRPAPSAARSVRSVGSGRSASGRARSTRLRLTRRARRLAVVLALSGGLLLGSVLGSLISGGQDEGLRLAGVSSVVVEPGDTLWSIAEAVADGDDVRVVVDRIQELNGLGGAGLVPGQELLLP
jgi:hypothetical protein